MKKLFIILLLPLIGCGNGQHQSEGNTKELTALLSKFKHVESRKAAGSSLCGAMSSPHQDYPTAHFYSKMFFLFGENESDGFIPPSYTIQHVKTNVIFTVYCGMFGPSYGCFEENKSDLRNITNEFETLFELAPYANCSFEYHTDFGKMEVGALDGVLYEKSLN